MFLKMRMKSEMADRQRAGHRVFPNTIAPRQQDHLAASTTANISKHDGETQTSIHKNGREALRFGSLRSARRQQLASTCETPNEPY